MYETTKTEKIFFTKPQIFPSICILIMSCDGHYDDENNGSIQDFVMFNGNSDIQNGLT